MKVALVHDYLKEYGGAERVLEALHEIWPEAPIYTAFVDFDGLGPHAGRIKKWDIRTSWVQKVWPVKKLHSPLRFITPWVWKYFDFSEFDVVITSSAWYIPRGIVTKPPTVHICYMHTPPRHLYGYETASNWKKYWFVRVYGETINHFLRQYDYQTAQNVDCFIANSRETQRRIKKFYRRESEVIYPPVEIRASGYKDAKHEESKGYYLSVSRLARAKHIDLAIGVCQKLGKSLVIVGKGGDEARLKSMVNGQMSNITFLGEVNDGELRGIYQNAKALIFPAKDEEFGIVPVEAMAAGVPVLAYRSGGVVETVVEGKTGLFFNKLTAASLIKTMEQLDNRAMKSSDCEKQAKKFSKELFQKRIIEFVKKIYNQTK